MRELRQLRIEDLVFIDTETVRNQQELTEGTADYDAWEYKVKRYSESNGIDLKQHYIDTSALYPEFSRIVCISVGRVRGGQLVITTYRDEDEKTMLERFMDDLNSVTKSAPKTRLCGHSVIKFDIPFIFKRCLVNGILPNELIDVGGLKPWEVTAMDTKTLWGGTSYYPASLISVCLALGIPSPKSDITGAEVSDVYYNEGKEGLDRISNYCEKDVLAVANVVRKCRFEEIFDSYEKREPKPKVKQGLVERISNTGMITKEDEQEILEKAKGSTHEEKERQIKILKSALLIVGTDFPQDLELEILKA